MEFGYRIAEARRAQSKEFSKKYSDLYELCGAERLVVWSLCAESAAGQRTALWRFLHEDQCVACWILEKRHPKIVIFHRRDQASSSRTAIVMSGVRK
jgi:hypothetical protein